MELADAIGISSVRGGCWILLEAWTPMNGIKEVWSVTFCIVEGDWSTKFPMDKDCGGEDILVASRHTWEFLEE
tara:strand:+ start:3831 stop:4049 length:219 start_codon:yes stop_codon:yes gene_type:complete